MPFDDNDLKRLKECQYQNEDIWAGLFNYYTKESEKVNISALLARLEASEKALASCWKVVNGQNGRHTVDCAVTDAEAWRKAAGK